MMNTEPGKSARSGSSAGATTSTASLASVPGRADERITRIRPGQCARIASVAESISPALTGDTITIEPDGDAVFTTQFIGTPRNSDQRVSSTRR